MAETPQLSIDPGRLGSDLERLAEFGVTRAGGVTRIAYSPEDLSARGWIEAQCAELGMIVRRDSAGNTIASLPGEEDSLASIAIASHTDSVPDGGRYDGTLGIVAGLACVRSLRGADVALRHPVALINFEAEEATMGGATFGSRAFVGQLDQSALRRRAVDGIEVGRHLEQAGLRPELPSEAGDRPLECAACLELHVEQGPILDRRDAPIGVVEGIAGIRRYEAVFRGAANHAGTTPMEERNDALVAAAPFVLTVRDAAREQGIVGTVGTVRVTPGAPNVIPGRVEFDVELRSTEDSRLAAVEESLRAAAAEQGGELVALIAKQPTPFSPTVIERIEAAARELGIENERLWSGAGHDAGVMASITEAGMIFVPSRDGISHSPDEFTPIEDCVTGAEVLLRTVLDLDSALD